MEEIGVMKYVIGDTDISLRRLYLAVEISEEIMEDNIRLLWRKFIERDGKLSSPRSAEPFFSLARELGFLQKREGRWMISFSEGRAFKYLYRKTRGCPRYFILVQFLKYDGWFLKPFLQKILEESVNYIDKKRLKTKLIIDIAKKAWKEMWSKHYNTLKMVEPPLLEDPKPRTLKHHASVVIKILREIRVSLDVLERLLKKISELEIPPLPNNIYFIVGSAFNNVDPNPIQEEEIIQKLHDFYYEIKGMRYASLYAAYSIINELTLPRNKAVTWSSIITTIRRNRGIFELQPSFTFRDYLYAPRIRFIT
ncbi:MAG: hypothetical protein NDF54_08950 [archaeon GB-1867-035]|nr:hypothetical protein [Candidatus Culexmicrobium profundum]